MLRCNGKTFMNLQEAVQWLLNNNALFFLCTEDYAADTEISLEELVNPSPANPKIGSLVLFADGKISTITGITDDSFTVGSEYTDLKYGREVDEFEIDASQHLIVKYMDGTSQDLGPIFSGNVSISGNLSVTGSINGESDPSVKPVYFHPVVVNQEPHAGFDDVETRCNLFILDNSPTPYTMARLISKLVSLMDGGAYILINGYSKDSGGTVNNLYVLQKFSEGVYRFYGNSALGRNAIAMENILNERATINDGVNKVN